MGRCFVDDACSGDEVGWEGLWGDRCGTYACQTTDVYFLGYPLVLACLCYLRSKPIPSHSIYSSTKTSADIERHTTIHLSTSYRLIKINNTSHQQWATKQHSQRLNYPHQSQTYQHAFPLPVATLVPYPHIYNSIPRYPLPTSLLQPGAPLSPFSGQAWTSRKMVRDTSAPTAHPN